MTLTFVGCCEGMNATKSPHLYVEHVAAPTRLVTSRVGVASSFLTTVTRQMNVLTFIIDLFDYSYMLSAISAVHTFLTTVYGVRNRSVLRGKPTV
jgi:hypothetical protein